MGFNFFMKWDPAHLLSELGQKLGEVESIRNNVVKDERVGYANNDANQGS